MTETMIGHQSLAHIAELAALLRAHWNDRERVPLSSQLLEIAQVLDEVPKLTAENEMLKQEVEHYNKSGIVEIAVRNPSVADYMSHWEGRAEKAEAENERLQHLLTMSQFAASELERANAGLTAENERLREALEEIVDSTEGSATEPIKDPAYGDIVRNLGMRIGFGALMSAASYEWRNRLKESGYPIGSEFVAGPCRAVLQSDIARARAALEHSHDA